MRTLGQQLCHRIPRRLPWGLLVLALGLLLARWPLSWIALLTAGVLGGTVLLLRPAWALAPLVLAVPLARVGAVGFAGMRIGPGQMILAGMLLVWMAIMASRRRVRFPHPPLLVPFLLLLGAMLASLWRALSLTLAVKELVKWGSMFAAYLFVVAHVRLRQSGWLIGAMLLAVSGQALFGIYQFVTGRGPEGFLLFGRFMRAYGTFEQPNPYAGYLALAIPLALALALQFRTPASRLATSAALGLSSVALVMSWSRGAWLGAAAAVATVGLLFRGRTALLTVAAAVTLGLVLSAPGLLPSTLNQRLSGLSGSLALADASTAEVTDASYALVERLAHWQAAIAMWADHPWLGVGIGNYPAAYPAYALPRWPEPLGHAHNYYLNVGAETGLIGLSCYVLFVTSALWYAYRTAHRTTGVPRAIALGTLGALVGLSVHSAFDNLYVHTIYLQIAVLLGLVCQENDGWRAVPDSRAPATRSRAMANPVERDPLVPKAC